MNESPYTNIIYTRSASIQCKIVFDNATEHSRWRAEFGHSQGIKERQKKKTNQNFVLNEQNMNKIENWEATEATEAYYVL